MSRLKIAAFLIVLYGINLFIPHGVLAARLDLQNLLDRLLQRKEERLQELQQVRQERQKQEGKVERLNDQITVTNYGHMAK